MNDFQLRARYYQLGVPVGLPHDLAVEFHGDPIEREFQMQEKGAKRESGGNLGGFAIHDDGDEGSRRSQQPPVYAVSLPFDTPSDRWVQ